MANKIIHKKSAVASKRPLLSELELGEIAINTRDAVIVFKSSNGTVERLESLAPERLTISGAAAGTVASTEHIQGLIASEVSTAAGSDTAAIASRGAKVSGNISAIIASGDGNATTDSNSQTTANRTLIAAANSCKAAGTQSAVIASFASETAQVNTAIIGSHSSKTLHQRSVIAASLGVATGTEGTLVGGWTGATGAITPAGSNRKWELDSVSGNARIAGALTSSAGFADIGEYYANATGEPIPLGTIVTLEGATVRPAAEGEPILGVVSATAAAALNDTPFSWQGRYLRGEFGELLTQSVQHVIWMDDEGGYEGPVYPGLYIPVQAIFYDVDLPIENPHYNPFLDQTPRSERPSEWTLVGLIGQVYIRVTEFVAPGDYVKPTTTPGRGGKSSTKSSIRCMRITTSYSAERGYAVALCTIKGGF